MKALAAALLFLAPPLACAEVMSTYCSDLIGMELEGKFVTVTTADGRPDNFTHGILVSITPDTVTTRLGAVFSYTNCNHVLTITVDTDAYGETGSPAGR